MNTTTTFQDQLSTLHQLMTRMRRADMFGNFGGNGKRLVKEIRSEFRRADGSAHLTLEQVCGFIAQLADLEDEARRVHGDERVDSWFRNEGEAPRRRPWQRPTQ